MIKRGGRWGERPEKEVGVRDTRSELLLTTLTLTTGVTDLWDTLRSLTSNLLNLRCSYVSKEICLIWKWIFDSRVQGEVWTRDENWGVLGMKVSFKVTGLDETIRIISLDKKRKRNRKLNLRP